MALIGAMKMKIMEGDGVGRKRTIITGISSNVILYSIGSKERLHLLLDQRAVALL